MKKEFSDPGSAAADVRQSEEFASFMQDIGWKTEYLKTAKVYLRKFPFIGFFAKCPRPDTPLDLSDLPEFIKNKKIFHFKISPNIGIKDHVYQKEKEGLLRRNFNIEKSPFNPTTTIVVDLKNSEKDIFKSFSEAKRRAVRRAIKHGVSVIASSDIGSFIQIRKQQFNPMGFLITKEMEMLWKNFYPEKSDLLLAKNEDGHYVGGVLLLYHNQIAYYWFASALVTGKKLFAPTLLVWEAIKLAKKKGCKVLDFEGVYDERFPKASESWRGFTKFKEGFSQKKIILMENFFIKRSIIVL